jgi:hypothetical protein
MADTDRQRILSEALRDVARDQAATAEAERAARRLRLHKHPPTLLILAVLAWGALAWLWIARPAAIFGSGADAVSMTADEQDAYARYGLYLQRARVERFREQQGRLPATLMESGPVETGVVFAATSDGYVLEAQAGAVMLRLTQRMNADSFLGDAVARLPRRTPQ